MARVFTEWFLALDGEQQRAFENERSRQEDAGREEWEAEQAAARGVSPDPEPQPPRRLLTDVEFYALQAELDASIPF